MHTKIRGGQMYNKIWGHSPLLIPPPMVQKSAHGITCCHETTLYTAQHHIPYHIAIVGGGAGGNKKKAVYTTIFVRPGGCYIAL